MMYWMVFAAFTFLESFTDLTLFWIPFYYELKLLFILWLVFAPTRGSSVIFRKLLYPQLLKREKAIDDYVQRIKDHGYAALIALGARGFTFATNMILSTAVKGQAKLADRLQRSYSLNDISSGSNIHRDVTDDDTLHSRRNMMTSRVHDDLDTEITDLMRRFDQQRNKTLRH